jgi:hypothetical protein
MNEIKNGVFIEFNFDHMTTTEFTSLGKGMNQRFVKVEDECFLLWFQRD